MDGVPKMFSELDEFGDINSDCLYLEPNGLLEIVNLLNSGDCFVDLSVEFACLQVDLVDLLFDLDEVFLLVGQSVFNSLCLWSDDIVVIVFSDASYFPWVLLTKGGRQVMFHYLISGLAMTKVLLHFLVPDSLWSEELVTKSLLRH